MVDEIIDNGFACQQDAVKGAAVLNYLTAGTQVQSIEGLKFCQTQMRDPVSSAPSRETPI